MLRNLLLIAFFVIPFHLLSQTGIGTTTPHASAKLEVASDRQGFLPPRMTSSQRNAITSPAAGLMVYQTDGTVGLYYRGAADWIYIINSSNNVLPVLNGGTGTTTSTGSGSVVLSNSPSLATPTLGFAIASGLTIGDATGVIPGDLTLNPTTNQYEGGQINVKKSIIGSRYDWIIDQYGTTSADARLRIFNTTEANGISILENGNVGMGTGSPSVRLQVAGDVIANSIAGSSDLRFKNNIQSVTNSLEKVKALRGVYFNWNQNDYPERQFGLNTELGFIAQEVEKIVPEVVTKDKTKDEFRSIKYDKLVALLVEAIKEQQKQIDSLKVSVKKLKK